MEAHRLITQIHDLVVGARNTNDPTERAGYLAAADHLLTIIDARKVTQEEVQPTAKRGARR